MTKSIRALIPYTIAVCLLVIICLATDAANSQDKYSTYANVRFSYSISYPTGLLIPQGEADNGDGQKFLFRDGKATMSVFGIYALDETLRHRYNEQLQEGRDDNRSTPTFTYKVLRSNWFVVSGREGDRIFYQKTILRKGVFKSFRIEYDKALSDVFDEVTKKVAASFRG